MNYNIREKYALILMCYKEVEERYHHIALKLKLSDTAFWILYGLCENNEPQTQNSLADNLFLPKQTVNSAILKLCSDGYIRLEQMASARNSKSVHLTEKGQVFCNKRIVPLLEKEKQAYADFTDEELSEFVSFCQRQCNGLNKAVSEYINSLDLD